MTEIETIESGLLQRCGDNRAAFLRLTAQVIREAVLHVLDGAGSFDELEGCEKTTFGIKFEKRFLRALALPQKVSKKNNPHKLALDTQVAGLPLDIKTTLGGSTWMIPRECLGHHCLVLRVDWRRERFRVGLVKTDVETVTKGKNQDKKHSLSKAGKQAIHWIGPDQSYAAPIVIQPSVRLRRPTTYSRRCYARLVA
ncbi:MAG: hypothetical protein EOP84_19435 [Verrucomicrobiaceae bacterium]|nr:MAG: hypothetical protein EOP84_19435 [Verrucomicrobiaceae bacterium]